MIIMQLMFLALTGFGYAQPVDDYYPNEYYYSYDASHPVVDNASIEEYYTSLRDENELNDVSYMDITFEEE